MSNDPDDTGHSDNIDTIRQLLRKLEEVAARDSERSPAPIGPPGIPPLQDLAALQPRFGALARPPVLTLPEVTSRSFEVDLDDSPLEETGRGRGAMSVAVALGSFVLGLGTAL